MQHCATRRLGEGAFGAVYGGESFFDEKGWVGLDLSLHQFVSLTISTKVLSSK
jgi:hypothetical protein